MTKRWPLLAGVLAVAVVIGGLVACQTSGSNTAVAPISKVETEDYHALALAPGNPDVVFFGHHGGILRSSDGGRNWQKVPSLNRDAMNLAAERQRPQVMYLAGHNVFMRSEDGGSTWTDVANDLPGLDLHWFAMNPDDPAKLYANAVGFGLFASSDNGATWSRWDLQVPGEGSVGALAVLGGDPVNGLAGMEDGLVLDSHDSGVTWEEVGRVDSMPTTFALNPDSRAIYLGTMKGVYSSRDGGISWTRLPFNTTVVALAAGGAGPERVVVVNNKGEVFRSDDGGQTW